MIKFGNYKTEFGFLGTTAAITVILVFKHYVRFAAKNTLTLHQYVYDQTTLTPFSFPAPQRKSISIGSGCSFFPMNQYL